MGKLRLLLWELGSPQILAIMCGLTLCGAALSPDFLRATFPASRISTLAPGLLSPAAWSLCRALGGALVTGLLWWGTALINHLTESPRIRPSEVLRWALCLQGLAFFLVLLEGSRHALTLALMGAGLGNAYSLPPFQFRQRGLISSLIIGGGVALAICGGMLSQTGVTEVGGMSAGVLGLVAAVNSLVKDYLDVEGDRRAGLHTLPASLGVRPALLIHMAIVACTYLLALVLLLHTVGMRQEVLGLFLLPVAAQLYVLGVLRANFSAVLAHRAFRQTVVIFLCTTALYVGAQVLP